MVVNRRSGFARCGNVTHRCRCGATMAIPLEKTTEAAMLLDPGFANRSRCTDRGRCTDRCGRAARGRTAISLLVAATKTSGGAEGSDQNQMVHGINLFFW